MIFLSSYLVVSQKEYIKSTEISAYMSNLGINMIVTYSKYRREQARQIVNINNLFHVKIAHISYHTAHN